MLAHQAPRSSKSNLGWPKLDEPCPSSLGTHIHGIANIAFLQFVTQRYSPGPRTIVRFMPTAAEIGEIESDHVNPLVEDIVERRSCREAVTEFPFRASASEDVVIRYVGSEV